MRTAAGERVWDGLVRLTHWSVAALVFWDWFEDSGGALHRNLGYLAAALVGVRLAWGFAGTRAARFSDWWPTRARLAAYVPALLAGRPPHTRGHNPLGALMMLALWACVLGLALTGWMSRWDRFWGDDALKDVHAFIADALMALVAVHVLAVAAMSRLEGENLAKAMITGRKRG